MLVMYTTVRYAISVVNLLRILGSMFGICTRQRTLIWFDRRNSIFRTNKTQKCDIKSFNFNEIMIKM